MDTASPPLACVWYSPQLLLVATASVTRAQHVGGCVRALPLKVNFFKPGFVALSMRSWWRRLGREKGLQSQSWYEVSVKEGASSSNRSPLIFNCAEKTREKGKGSPEKREKSGVQDAAGRGAVGRPDNFAAQPESR